MEGDARRPTEEEIPYSTQFNGICKFRMPQHLPADAVFSNVVFVHRDFLGPWINFDDARREALLEFFSEVRWDELFDFDVGKETVRCGGYKGISIQAG